MSFEKCTCTHCGQNIEYPSEGRGSTVPCPTCENPVTLKPDCPSSPFGSIIIPVAPEPILRKEKKQNVAKHKKTALSKLTEETIRSKTKAGDTPLHRAAKNGQIDQIPSDLLSVDLFMDKNNGGETPLHISAKHGHLDQVPLPFLTKETMTMSVGPGTYSTGAGYLAHTETVLHIAVRCGHVEQIPKEFLAPEFLSMEATGYRLSLLHELASINRLDLVPDIYAHDEMWNLKDNQGRTPCEVVEDNSRREAHVADVRDELATEKQKDKLRWFECTWDEGITKGQASDAIDECIRRFPGKDTEYYNRPATEEQLEKLTTYLVPEGAEPDDYAEGQTLTYGEAKDLISECELQERQEQEEKEMAACEPPTEAQVKALRDSGFKVERYSHLTKGVVEALLKLEGLPPRQEDLDLFKRHGLKFHQGDAFAAYGLGVLIRQFEEMATQSQSYVNIVNACTAAMNDPAYLSATVAFDDDLGEVVFTWPKKSLRQWFQQGLE